MPCAIAGDADYNNEVDAARVANHQVFLYHSSAVAHTLRGNVDYSEPWHDFLARKSGEPPDSLEDVGFVERHTTPQANMGSASMPCKPAHKPASLMHDALKENMMMPLHEQLTFKYSLDKLFTSEGVVDVCTGRGFSGECKVMHVHVRLPHRKFVSCSQLCIKRGSTNATDQLTANPNSVLYQQ